MATRESGGMGIDHLTVVPENLDAEPTADGEPDAPSEHAAADDESESDDDAE